MPAFPAGACPSGPAIFLTSVPRLALSFAPTHGSGMEKARNARPRLRGRGSGTQGRMWQTGWLCGWRAASRRIWGGRVAGILSWCPPPRARTVVREPAGEVTAGLSQGDAADGRRGEIWDGAPLCGVEATNRTSHQESESNGTTNGLLYGVISLTTRSAIKQLQQVSWMRLMSFSVK